MAAALSSLNIDIEAGADQPGSGEPETTSQNLAHQVVATALTVAERPGITCTNSHCPSAGQDWNFILCRRAQLQTQSVAHSAAGACFSTSKDTPQCAAASNTNYGLVMCTCHSRSMLDLHMSHQETSCSLSLSALRAQHSQHASL